MVFCATSPCSQSTKRSAPRCSSSINCTAQMTSPRCAMGRPLATAIETCASDCSSRIKRTCVFNVNRGARYLNNPLLINSGSTNTRTCFGLSAVCAVPMAGNITAIVVKIKHIVRIIGYTPVICALLKRMNK